jgi:hypothetical protein
MLEGPPHIATLLDRPRHVCQHRCRAAVVRAACNSWGCTTLAGHGARSFHAGKRFSERSTLCPCRLASAVYCAGLPSGPRTKPMLSGSLR